MVFPHPIASNDVTKKMMEGLKWRCKYKCGQDLHNLYANLTCHNYIYIYFFCHLVDLDPTMIIIMLNLKTDCIMYSNYY